MDKATFVKHSPCPQCHSRDNRGLYSDGSSYCFGCHYFWKPNLDVSAVERLAMNRQNLYRLQDGEASTENHRTIYLPEDAVSHLSPSASNWISQYIDVIQAKSKGFLWSESLSRLIVPIYDRDKNVIFWQGRYIGTDANKLKPKYLSEGPSHTIVKVLGDESLMNPRVTVVEDMISAIKVSVVTPAMCIFGSYLSPEQVRRLSSMYDQLTIWLDPDKRKGAIQQAMRHAHLFKAVDVIYSTKDPKEHTYPEIRDYVFPQPVSKTNIVTEGNKS
jgi:hypothetical protein